MSNKQKLFTAIKNKNLVKVISGIKNYDANKTLKIAMAAEAGNATAVDICDDIEILKKVKSQVKIPTFVSSISAEKLILAAQNGADALEIGNYESFYTEGKKFSSKEILEIAKDVKNNISNDVFLCCTIPATLSIESQLKLAEDLQELGVDLIQTEGFAPQVPSSERNDASYVDILKASSTLTNTLEIKKSVPGLNILSASGITPNTAPLAISMGACGVGVGHYISSAPSDMEMIERVKELVTVVNCFALKFTSNIKEVLMY